MKVTISKTIEQEIEINFPYVTFDKKSGAYYYNPKEGECITIFTGTNSILASTCINAGLHFEQCTIGDYYAAFDKAVANLIQIIDK